MHIIEPCCAVKHVADLRKALGTGGTLSFEGYGDLSLTELLPAILTHYSAIEMLIAAPSLPEQAVAVIRKWMKVQWPRMDGSGNVDVLSHLTLITDMAQSPDAATLPDGNPFGDRLTLAGCEVTDTVILLPDFAIQGPVNMRYGRHFTATATTDKDAIADLWATYRAMAAKPARESVEREEEMPSATAKGDDGPADAETLAGQQEGNDAPPETPEGDDKDATGRRRPSSFRRRR